MHLIHSMGILYSAAVNFCVERCQKAHREPAVAVSGFVFYCWSAVASLNSWNAPHFIGLIILRGDIEKEGVADGCPLLLNTMVLLLKSFYYCLP